MSTLRGRPRWITVLASTVACAALLRVGMALAASKADIAEGEIKFNTYCRQCHSWLKGDNRLGPSLYGIVGRKAGTAPGYLGYSSAMKEAGWIWTRAMINEWITNPYKILPDTNMRPFPGIPDQKTRTLIIDFLASHHDPAHKASSAHRGTARHHRAAKHHASGE